MFFPVGFPKTSPSLLVPTGGYEIPSWGRVVVGNFSVYFGWRESCRAQLENNDNIRCDPRLCRLNVGRESCKHKG